MTKNYENLIGYYMGNEVRVKDGVPYLVAPSEAEKINRRISEINHELKHAKKLLNDFRKEQLELRHKVRYELDSLNFSQQEKLKKSIREHRAILGGLQNYIAVLNREHTALQKSHPKQQMKPKELTPEEKAKKKQNRENGHKIGKLKGELFKLDNDCIKCHGNFNDDCCDCWVIDKRSDLKQEIENLTKK